MLWSGVGSNLINNLSFVKMTKSVTGLDLNDYLSLKTLNIIKFLYMLNEEVEINFRAKKLEKNSPWLYV